MQTGLGLDAAKTFFNNPACRLFFAFSGAHSHHGSDSPIHGKDVQPERPFFFRCWASTDQDIIYTRQALSTE